jgi:hypothetical protein
MSFLGWATLALAAATTVSAFYAEKMSRKTSDLANANEKLVEQNERHHIEDQRPILILEYKFNPELMANRTVLLGKIDPTQWRSLYPEIQDNFALFLFGINEGDVKLKNCGKGIALNPTILIRFEDNSGKELRSDFSAIPADSFLTLQAVAFRTKLDSALLDSRKQVMTNEYHALFGQPWKIFIEYDDIYGNHYYTMHTKDPTQRWIILGDRGQGVPSGKSRDEIKAELAMTTLVAQQSGPNKAFDL